MKLQFLKVFLSAALLFTTSCESDEGQANSKATLPGIPEVTPPPLPGTNDLHQNHSLLETKLLKIKPPVYCRGLVSYKSPDESFVLEGTRCRMSLSRDSSIFMIRTLTGKDWQACEVVTEYESGTETFMKLYEFPVSVIGSEYLTDNKEKLLELAYWLCQWNIVRR